MFIPKKRPEGWSFIALGIFFCALGLVFMFQIFGPTSGRGETLAVVGVPIGVIAIVIGVVKLVRDERKDPPTGDEDTEAAS
ncbi:hypothetical protein ACFXQA_04400 [Microbacterium sp. P07]|uniref:hypothetical protein n=1 Tax=Microbacterium sp. P07 TaxID=3366952 RepID=UPI003746C2BE